MDSQSHVTGRKPNPFRRPLHSFSLRALLFVVLLVGAVLGWLSVRIAKARQQRSQVESIELAGGRVFYGFEPPAWAEQWLGTDLLADVTVVLFWQKTIPDETFAAIARLPGLCSLDLDDCQFSRQGISKLANPAHPERLSVHLRNATDQALADLAESLSGLDVESLQVGGSQLSDAALSQIVRLQTLRNLEICGPEITDAGAEQLVALPKLEFVLLQGTRVTDECEQRLRKVLPAFGVERRP